MIIIQNGKIKPKPLIKLSIACTCLLFISACEDKNLPVQPTKTHILFAPFDVIELRHRYGAPDVEKFKCKSSPRPIKDLFFESIYDESSENASIVDPEAAKQYKEDTKDIKSLETGLVRYANRYILSKPPRAEIANCLITWMDQWGQDEALLGKSNHMGDFVRKWALAASATAYLQVRDEVNLDPKKLENAQKWLKTLTARVIQDFTARPDKTSRNNNHMYWAAWGVMSASVALDDKQSFNWAVNKAREGIKDIQADGSLPLEMNRGAKAYLYHHYAAIPLFMMAHTAKANGVDLYKENNQGLQRLARLILKNMDDQSYFSKKTGVAQNMDRVITKSTLSWLEPYFVQTKDPDAIKWLTAYRPLKQSRVGGDATLLYSFLSETQQKK